MGSRLAPAQTWHSLAAREGKAHHGDQGQVLVSQGGQGTVSVQHEASGARFPSLAAAPGAAGQTQNGSVVTCLFLSLFLFFYK